ncbi:hypothetical protein HIM_03521 [Hirsutella minnesotensis 3608]|uniref:deuterolysin n=1 Tax=Hirsutella minnesotensis 3608 TaxID=1043627 RepID=A0A0F7ZQG3_9HYPO|nr:hypothetical protein HIM_03521 [Hirsutella minnesotensis 3608]
MRHDTLITVTLLACLTHAVPSIEKRKSDFLVDTAGIGKRDLSNGLVGGFDKREPLPQLGSKLIEGITRIPDAADAPSTAGSKALNAFKRTVGKYAFGQTHVKRARVGEDCNAKGDFVQQSLKTCSERAGLAAQEASKPDSRLLQQFFKNNDQGTASQVSGLYNKIKQECDAVGGGSLNLVCPDDNACGKFDAFANPNAPGGPQIMLCRGFFEISDGPSGGRRCGGLDAGSLMIHEMSHLLGGTSDFGTAYGLAAVQSLSAAQNLQHADTYGLFAHAVALGCSDGDLQTGGAPSGSGNTGAGGDKNSPIGGGQANGVNRGNQGQNALGGDARGAAGNGIPQRTNQDNGGQGRNRAGPGQQVGNNDNGNICKAGNKAGAATKQSTQSLGKGQNGLAGGTSKQLDQSKGVGNTQQQGKSNTKPGKQASQTGKGTVPQNGIKGNKGKTLSGGKNSTAGDDGGSARKGTKQNGSSGKLTGGQSKGGSNAKNKPKNGNAGNVIDSTGGAKTQPGGKKKSTSGQNSAGNAGQGTRAGSSPQGVQSGRGSNEPSADLTPPPLPGSAADGAQSNVGQGQTSFDGSVGPAFGRF